MRCWGRCRAAQIDCNMAAPLSAIGALPFFFLETGIYLDSARTPEQNVTFSKYKSGNAALNSSATQ